MDPLFPVDFIFFFFKFPSGDLISLLSLNITGEWRKKSKTEFISINESGQIQNF